MTRLTTPTLALWSISTLLTLASAGTILYDIEKNPAAQAAQLQRRAQTLQRRALGRRASTVTAPLNNAENQGLYGASVTVGTPGQKFLVQIDTGSSDMWVPASSATFCKSSDPEEGCPNGSFTSSSSSTFEDVEQGGFNISYVDGTGATGDYFQDTFTIGGSTLKNFQMGLALDTTIGTGIMGIGYNNSEANVDTGNKTEYANLPLALVDQGLINSAAYSLWLNDLQATSGSILFGGIDTAKYSGDLISVEVYPDSNTGQVTSFTVALTSLSATSSSGSDELTPPDYAVAAILDSGTTLTLLPDDVAAAIYEEVGATYSQRLGGAVVPCSLAENTGTINYGFGGPGGPTIQVSVSQLVLPLDGVGGNQPTYTNGEAACQLGIQPAGDAPILLGDTFLRSAYVVYDLENNRIAIAPTDFNSTKSNVVEFPSKGAAIPSASTAANGAAVTQTATGIPKGGQGGQTATAAGTAVATYNPTATGFSAAAGFAAATSTSTGSSKKHSAGVEGPRPFAWSTVWVACVSMTMMGLGGGVFAFL